jgi:hypothetical protein
LVISQIESYAHSDWMDVFLFMLSHVAGDEKHPSIS